MHCYIRLTKISLCDKIFLRIHSGERNYRKMFERLRRLNWRQVIASILITFWGLCLLFLTGSAIAITILSGTVLALLGLALGYLNIKSPKRDCNFVLRIVIASLLFASGVTVTVLNDYAFEAVIAAICLALVVDGSFKFNIAIQSKRHLISGWWIIMSISAVVILSAFLLAKFTPESYRASSIWLSMTMIVDAAANLISPIFNAKCQTTAKAEIYYEINDDF